MTHAHVWKSKQWTNLSHLSSGCDRANQVAVGGPIGGRGVMVVIQLLLLLRAEQVGLRAGEQGQLAVSFLGGATLGTVYTSRHLRTKMGMTHSTHDAQVLRYLHLSSSPNSLIFLPRTMTASHALLSQRLLVNCALETYCGEQSPCPTIVQCNCKINILISESLGDRKYCTVSLIHSVEHEHSTTTT